MFSILNDLENTKISAPLLRRRRVNVMQIMLYTKCRFCCNSLNWSW